LEKQPWWHKTLMRDWENQVSVFLTGLILLQYITWLQQEDGVWLPETVVIMKLTLLAAAVIEMIPSLHWTLRRLLQLTSALSATSYILGIEPVGREISKLRDLGILIHDNFMQLTPFIWFAISVWLILLAVLKIMRTKRMIWLVLVATVTVMAIRDSYSSLHLWKQVATVILCSLFLLIIRHFTELHKQLPDTRFILASPRTILPIVLLVSSVVYVGTLAPEVKAVLTDPYTMWSGLQGRQLSLFNNGSSTTSSSGGDSVSGYSSDDSSIGGQLTLDTAPVMSVISSYPSYWRGETRSSYTGDGWTAQGQNGVLLSSVPPSVSLLQDPESIPGGLRTIEVTQTMTMASDSEQNLPVLFGAYAIDSVQSVSREGRDGNFPQLQWSSRAGELRWKERRWYPDSYTIISKVPIVDEAELRKLPAEPPIPPGLGEYLLLPETLPSRVRELALQVTRSGTNMYDKVKLIEQYLANTYPYTTNPNEGVGNSPDFVDRFLFEIKEGYCDYYSTAMAVMVRSIGLPSRWVKGFATGEAGGEGIYTVRNADAHSWVEVNFPGFGWIPFEPTSGFVLPVYTSAEEVPTEPIQEASPEPEVSSDSETAPPPIEEEKGSISRLSGWAAGIAVSAVLLSILWINRRRIPVLQHIGFNNSNGQWDINRKAALEFDRFFRYAKRRGYSRLKHQTVREALFLWGDSEKGMGKDDLESLLMIFEKTRYSGSDITNEELSAVRGKVQELRLGENERTPS
jgi:transglutaminase-like putative cysteine protease